MNFQDYMKSGKQSNLTAVQEIYFKDQIEKKQRVNYMLKLIEDWHNALNSGNIKDASKLSAHIINFLGDHL